MSITLARRTRATLVASIHDSEPVEEPSRHPANIREMPLYAVVLHNDDRHTLKFCSMLLREVFKCNEASACVLTWQVHTNGRAAVWSGDLDAAEQKCDEAERYQRRAVDHDFRSSWDLDAGQPPMRTTIERIDTGPPADHSPQPDDNGRR